MKKDKQDQRGHYDGFAEKYAQHYDDPTSLEYRDRFIYDRLFLNCDLSNTLVLDALCGSGGSASNLSGRGVRVVGLDISLKELQIYRSVDENRNATCDTAFSLCFPSQCFDHIVIISGLHHLQPKINDALFEFHRVLEKGGSI